MAEFYNDYCLLGDHHIAVEWRMGKESGRCFLLECDAILYHRQHASALAQNPNGCGMHALRVRFVREDTGELTIAGMVQARSTSPLVVQRSYNISSCHTVLLPNQIRIPQEVSKMSPVKRSLDHSRHPNDRSRSQAAPGFIDLIRDCSCGVPDRKSVV